MFDLIRTSAISLNVNAELLMNARWLFCLVLEVVVLLSIAVQPKLIVEVSVVSLIVLCLLHSVLLAQLETCFAECVGILARLCQPRLLTG